MLIQFKVANFLSFKEEQIFSMVASSLTELPKNRIEIEKDEFYLLKTASIFGANASGKSNLLAAVSFMSSFIVNSFKDSQDEGNIADISFALNNEYRNKDSYFELTYLENDSLVRYGFEVGKKRVAKEWLYKDEVLVYEREKDKLTKVNEDFLEKKETELKINMTNNKALFLTILGSTNTPFAEEIVNYFRYKINIVHGLGGGNFNFTKKIIKDGNKIFTKKIVDMLKVADFNINRLDIKSSKIQIENVDNEEIPEELLKQIELDSNRLLTEHNIYDNDGNIEGTHRFDSEVFESSGTNEFLKISGPIIDTLEKGKVLFIDEVDAQLHPLMTKYILNLFNSDKNEKNAQLIITSHNSTILDGNVLRRDQIWFTEKDKVEASHLTSLSNYRFKGEVVRKDEKFDKNYLKGKYGAIPIIQNSFIDKIFSGNSEEL